MIDLRSDTVTRPSAEMLDAMMRAQTGDDVYGEDPTVNRLEALGAEITGKEAGLFVSSGTQSNLLALLSHCARGDEYIAGQDAHTYLYEAGGGAVLGGIQPQPIPFNDKGELPLEAIEAVIKPDEYHFAKTRLLCLENTVGGKALALPYLRESTEFAKAKGLATHLDGARLFNAAVKLQVPAAQITQGFDTVSFCLSKGLAAPVGSVLTGSKQVIGQARRYRKMLGGGMRQAGVLAAAGIYALENNVARLAEDHDRVAQLAAVLKQLPAIPLAEEPQTNMIMLALDGGPLKQLAGFLKERKIRINGARWVLHRDVSGADVEAIAEACRAYQEAHG